MHFSFKVESRLKIFVWLCGWDNLAYLACASSLRIQVQPQSCLGQWGVWYTNMFVCYRGLLNCLQPHLCIDVSLVAITTTVPDADVLIGKRLKYSNTF